MGLNDKPFLINCYRIYYTYNPAWLKGYSIIIDIQKLDASNTFAVAELT